MAEFAANGFTGGLNWYRNLDRNWALTAAWHGAPITPPALFLAGEQDLVVAGIGADALAATLRRTCTDLREERAEQLRPWRAAARWWHLPNAARAPPGRRAVGPSCSARSEARLLPGCGHWTQQEPPAEMSAALIAFATDPDRWSPT